MLVIIFLVGGLIFLINFFNKLLLKLVNFFSICFLVVCFFIFKDLGIVIGFDGVFG